MNRICKIGWIKRRARQLQRYYQIDRSHAVSEAWIDWRNFVGGVH